MRVVVVGTSGAGKTTMANSLATRLDLPCVELDRHWESDWRALTETDPAEFDRRVHAAIAGEAWVSDGNYSQVSDLVWRNGARRVCLQLSHHREP